MILTMLFLTAYQLQFEAIPSVAVCVVVFWLTFYKLTSVLYASVLLLIMNFVITMSK